MLRYIRNVRWQYGDIIPDYQLGATTCAIFLSLRSASLSCNRTPALSHGWHRGRVGRALRAPGCVREERWHTRGCAGSTC